MTGINKENFVYKSLRPSEIIKSEKKVQRIVNVLKEEYINPFSRELDKSKLYNLSSGIPVPEHLAEMILRPQKRDTMNILHSLKIDLRGITRCFTTPSSFSQYSPESKS